MDTDATTLTRSQAARRDRVIRAALDLGASGGYDAVQMRDVSARADVAMGTIYRYFSSKDELLVAGLAGWVEHVRKRTVRRVPQGGTLADRVADTLTEASTLSEGQARLVRTLMTAIGSPDPSIGQYRDQVQDGIDAMISAALEGASDVDVAGVTRIIHHVWSSAFARWVSGQTSAAQISADLRSAAHLLLDGKS